MCFYFDTSFAQFYPVQITPQLIPPYSVYLSDYATPGNEKLRVIILQRDLTQPAYQLRLVMSVELNGRVIMRTARSFNPAPLSLDPGVPTIISGTDLMPYLDSRNIDFVGYSREQYEKTRALPEGSYRITFTAYDYRRQEVQVSNEGSSFYFLSKNEPPLINFPACGAKIPARMPQQIIFSWLPRNTASPNSAAETEYEFSLFEARPEGRNPNDVVLSTQPVFRVRTDFPQLVYGPAEPMLIENMKYVWRVQSIDKNGRDAFRNNGYSEVCTFTYGGIAAGFDLGAVKNLQAAGETERRGKIWWEASNYDGYKVYYKKAGTGYEWFWSNVVKNELKLFDLEPDTEYETRVQVKKSGALGPYSEIIKFRTKPKQVVDCGKETPTVKADESKPLLAAHKGMIIVADGMPIRLLEVVPLGNGWFKGMGAVGTKLLKANFHVKFERLFIDENQVAGFGRIDFITKGVADLVKQQMANAATKDKRAQQQANREQWADQLFQEKIFKYDDIIISDIHFEGDVLIITDGDGNTIQNNDVSALLIEAPEKAIIIEDKNGEQWVVQKDENGNNKVTKVSAGGLVVGPDGKIISEKTLKILHKKILAALNKYKKAIEEYQASIKEVQPGKGGGPSLSEEEVEMLLAELPACLESSKGQLDVVSNNITKYLDITSAEWEQFIADIAHALEPTFPTEDDRDNAPDEKVEEVVCEALASSLPCLGIFDDCDDVKKKLEMIKSAYNESKKLTGKIPYSAASRVLNGTKIKVGGFDYNMISIQFTGEAEKNYTINPKGYVDYDEHINSTLGGVIHQRGFAFKENKEIILKILVFEEDEEKFKEARKALGKYLFEGSITVKPNAINLSAQKAVEDVLTYKNEDDPSCNLCTRTALLNLKKDPVLFPKQGSYVFFTFDKETDPEIKGEISGDGSALEIVNDFENYQNNTLQNYFAEEIKLDNETYEQFWKRLQNEADNGEVIIGVYKPKHVFMIVSGGMIKVVNNINHTTEFELNNENKVNPIIEEGDKYGFCFALKNVEYVPRILECGANIKSSNAPLYSNMDYKGVTNIRIANNLRWFRYIKK